MGNEFHIKPELAEGFPGFPAVWEDPITGLTVPKTPLANLEWRVKLIEAAEEDEGLRADLITACSQSVLFFINAFVYTLRVFETAESGKTKQAEAKHLPFITWPKQDEHLLWIEQHIDNGEEGLTDKSRDMGATWDHIAVYVHRLLFRDSESHLMLSRKEDTVDILDGMPKNYPFGVLSDPGTLFGKVDYVLARLPEWMVPRFSRKKMHLVNLDNGTRLDGESSNATAGSADRRTSIFLDEMAKMKEGEAIKRSTRDVTACRLANSTPNGAGTAFSKWRLSGTIDVFVMPWWEHPEKGRGRYVQQDELGRWKIRSPWYDSEATIRSPKELAIEVDMDHVGSGDLFFEASVIEQHKTLFACPPTRCSTINFHKRVAEVAIPEALLRRDIQSVHYTPNGPWQIWCALTNGRPDQSKTYVVAADISKGMGASNSTISISCIETKEKIAAYADANTPPYALAKLACAACLWVGGRTRAILIWENNGDPGFDFGRQIVQVYRYPNVYFDRQVGTQTEKRGKRYGWRSSPEKKAIALGMLRRAYAHGGFINHDAAALGECLTYVHYENGGIGPAELVEESDSARKTHGDRVIADMLCVVAMNDQTSTRPPVVLPPTNSIGHRLASFKRSKHRNVLARTFDFSRS